MAMSAVVKTNDGIFGHIKLSFMMGDVSVRVHLTARIHAAGGQYSILNQPLHSTPNH